MLYTFFFWNADAQILLLRIDKFEYEKKMCCLIEVKSVEARVCVDAHWDTTD